MSGIFNKRKVSMKPEDEKVFDEQFDKMLAGCSKEVRDIVESQRTDLKKMCDEVALDIKTTDDFMRRRLGALYPFMFPYADEKEVPIYRIRPTKEE
jgi:hypothetical protein